MSLHTLEIMTPLVEALLPLNAEDALDSQVYRRRSGTRILDSFKLWTPRVWCGCGAKIAAAGLFVDSVNELSACAHESARRNNPMSLRQSWLRLPVVLSRVLTPPVQFTTTNSDILYSILRPRSHIQRGEYKAVRKWATMHTTRFVPGWSLIQEKRSVVAGVGSTTWPSCLPPLDETLNWRVVTGLEPFN